MKNIYFVWKRESVAYFTSPVAYIVVILFLLITGSLFWFDYFREINQLTLRGFFNQAPLFLAFFAPAITMGLLATEKKEGTLELLMTMPISDFQIVIGKFLASVTLLMVVFLMTLPYPFSLSRLGELDWGSVWAGYLGLILLASSYAAIGIMASSFVKDQVVAILVSFSMCFGLFLIEKFGGNPTGTSAHILEYLSTNYHFQNIARGVIDVRDVFYYFSIIVISLVIAQASVSSRRW